MARTSGERTTEAFRGFPPDAITFYEGLEADNTRAYWQAHKDDYERLVKGPLLALLAELSDGYGPFHLFRPNRDVRFSKDKSPYKTAIGAVGEREGGAVYYVQLSSAGLLVASGYYQMATDQLARFRAAVDDPATGGPIAGIVAALEQAGYQIGAIDELKTAPRGYPKDHPRVDLLRRKGLTMSRSWPVRRWVHTARAKDRVVEVWRAADPLNDWLDAHVGPSELAPDPNDVR